MRVFAETNFLLEIAYRQADFRSCLRLVAAAEHGELDLLIPAICFAEASESLRRRSVRFQTLGERLKEEVEQLTRGSHPEIDPFKRDANDLTVRMSGFTPRERLRFSRLRTRPIAAECVLLSDEKAVEKAAAFELPWEEVDRGRPRGYGRTDAAILGCVVADLAARPATDAVFVTTDRGLREHPVTTDACARVGCEVRDGFDEVARRAVA